MTHYLPCMMIIMGNSGHQELVDADDSSAHKNTWHSLALHFSKTDCECIVMTPWGPRAGIPMVSILEDSDGSLDHGQLGPVTSHYHVNADTYQPCPAPTFRPRHAVRGTAGRRNAPDYYYCSARPDLQQPASGVGWVRRRGLAWFGLGAAQSACGWNCAELPGVWHLQACSHHVIDKLATSGGSHSAGSGLVISDGLGRGIQSQSIFIGSLDTADSVTA
jgi:hypothetical protein